MANHAVPLTSRAQRITFMRVWLATYRRTKDKPLARKRALQSVKQQRAVEKRETHPCVS